MEQGGTYWTRFARTQASRRRFLQGAAITAGGLAAAMVAGCGKGTSSGNGASGGGSGTDYTVEEFRTEFHGRKLKDLPGWDKKPQYGGVLAYSSQTPPSWDITGAAASTLASHAFFHNQLIRFKLGDLLDNPNFMEVEMDMASGLEQPDDLTYVFSLQDGIKFHDVPPVGGRAVTAEDVAYCLDIYRNSPTQAPALVDLESIQTPDPRTIVIKMARPTAYFIGTFVLPYYWIFPREQYEQHIMAERPIGTGAFILQSQEQLEGYVAVKNPEYFKKDPWTGMRLPYLDGVEIRRFGTPAGSVAAFRTGEIQHLWPQDFDTWRQVIETNPDSVTQVTTPPPSFQPYIVLNLTNPPLDDVRVRRALSLAIDRDALISAVAQGMAGYGYGQDHTYFGSEWPFGPEELGDWHRYDPDKAKRLLAEAGYADGLPRKLEFFLGQTAGFNYNVWVAVAGMWEQIGIQTDIRYSDDPAQWRSLYFERKYRDLMGIGFVGPAWDPDGFAYAALHSKSSKNYYFVNDPVLDDLTVKQRLEMDPEKRKALLREIKERDLDQVYRIWTVEPYKINLRKPNVYNLMDTEAAWSTLGWGSAENELVWFDRA